MAWAVAAIPALIAIVVLAGWAVGSPAMQRAGLASVTMNPMTALCLLALSAALLACRRGRVLVCAGRAVMLSVMAIGFLKLFDICAFPVFRVDAWLFAAKAHGLPGAMAPNTALCLVLTAGALLTTPRAGKGGAGKGGAPLAQGLALSTAAIATVAILGYLYGVSALYGVGAFFPMALHAAIGFLCLSAYVFMVTATYGLIAPISDTGPAGRTSRALLPAALLVPILCGWLSQQGERARWYGANTAMALVVTVTMLCLIAVIWWNAEQVRVADIRRRRAEIDLARLAYQDFLTGLPNRAHFMNRLNERMAHHRRRTDAMSFAVITMDMDGFKLVNDQLGHVAGDTLLREVSLHLQRCGRTRSDLVARLGGDEFAMLLDHVRSVEEAAVVARRIVNGMPQKCGPAGRQVPVGMSVGIVLADLSHESPEAVLNDADQALYDAKRQGKGQFTVYQAAA